MSQEDPTPAELAKMEAQSFVHFYRKHPEFAGITANTFLLRSTAAELGLQLQTYADVKHVANYLGTALAQVRPEQTFTPEPPTPSYEDRLKSHNAKLASADPRTLRKLALVQALQTQRYTPDEISGELALRGFSPVTEEESTLLSPPTRNETDVAIGQGAADELASASAHIGKLLGRGPVSGADIKALSADETRRLLWPGGQGTPMDKRNEQMIDMILRGR
jgi:hypothetical protein